MANDEYFTKAMQKAGQKLIRENKLTNAEKAMLFNLQFFMQITSVFATSGKHSFGWIVDEEGKPMNISSIGKLCGINRHTTGRTLTSLQTHGILERKKLDGSGCGIHLNEKYFTTRR